MSRAVGFAIVLWVAFSVWTIFGWFAVSRLQMPPHEVISHADAYEVRRYPAYLVAQIQMSGPWSQALATGRSILAKYAAGDNTTQASIAITVPVGIQPEPESEVISIDAPMIQELRRGSWIVSYVLPSEYSLDTIPRPNDPRIRLVEVPSQKLAVLGYGGVTDQSRSVAKMDELRDLLVRDKQVTLSPFRLIQYGPSWAPPFVRRNEVIVTVR